MSLRKPRIAFYIGSLNPGGSEKHVVRLLESLPAAGFEVALVLNRKEGLLLPRVRELGVESTEIRLDPTSRGRIKWLIGMTQFLRRGHFDILQAFNDVSIVYAGLAAALSHTPILLYGQRNTGYLVSGYKKKLVAWLCRCRVTGILVNAEAARKQVVSDYRVPDSKVRVIYNGIELYPLQADSELRAIKCRENLPLDRLLVVMVASLTPRKNVNLLIEAASILRDKPVDYLVIGAGSERSRLENLAIALQVQDRFHFINESADPLRWVQLCDIGVLSSWAEGLPNCILEYMALGLPVVATAVDGVPELVADQQTGFLVTPGNAADFAKALGRLIENKDLRLRMGIAGRERAAQRFSLQQEIASHVDAYQHWLNGRN